VSAPRRKRAALAVLLVSTVVAGAVVVLRTNDPSNSTRIAAYFANSNGIFVGDDVRILGVRVGRVDRIEPQPQQVKIDFSVDADYKVPAEAKAAILSPTLVTARAIQLIPAYTSGPVLADNAVIPQSRTAVPVEWDDVRTQLQKVADALEPSQPGGVSTLGALINTAADNLRGQGGNIRDTVIKLSQALSILGDHSTDVFSTAKNLSVLVSALQDSASVLSELNQNLSAVSALLANSPNEVGAAVRDLNQAAHDVADFAAANRETVGVTSDKLASLSQAFADSLDDIKQVLHAAPNTLANVNNMYNPAQGSITGTLAVNNFANPISFICGGIEAASRLNGEQAAKLCAQYLAPIIKNREYNFPPIGTTIGLAAPIPVVGAAARPNEITYSEDWMRPDYVPPPPPSASSPQPPTSSPLAAEGTEAPDAPAANDTPVVPTNPQAGLTGMMVPPSAGS
jgi:phospholipid/cholesterol/gamma-HCH transport system substrate-binding protein